MTPAADKLCSLLTTDWRPATAVTSQAEALGLTPDQIRGAREALGVTKVNSAVAFQSGRWHWRLPPGGCVVCGRSWHGPWAQVGGDGDYWSQARPSSPTSGEVGDGFLPEEEPPAPTTSSTQPTRYEPYGPPVCDRCGRTSAQDRGRPCPWRPTGSLCGGTMR